MTETTKAVEVKKQTPLQEFRTTLESPEMREQIRMALPQHIPVEKFSRVVTTAVSNDPKLLAANRLSLYNACMKCAADGLVPDGKEAALVPFKETVAYMPMISGILKKVRNSGELESIYAEIVHKNDKFTFQPGVDSVPNHQPEWFSARGEAIGVYAVAKTKDGGVYVEIMSKDQVMAVKNVARTKEIWDGAFGLEKWKVACLRRLSKRLPMSTDLEAFQKQFDEDIDTNLNDEDLKKPEPTPEVSTTKSSRLSAAVNAARPTPQPAPAPEPTPKAPPQEPNEDPNVGDGELPI